MLRAVGVDLASRFSACVALGAGGEVCEQWDSSGLTQREVADKIVATATTEHTPVVVIEDLPPHVPSSQVTKSVAQLQGRVIQQFPEEVLARVYFVPPAYWQRPMGVWRASPTQGAAVAAELGYCPPDLLASRGLIEQGKGTATAVALALKQMSDYVDAYLIAAWAQGCMARDEAWDLTIVRQYKS